MNGYRDRCDRCDGALNKVYTAIDTNTRLQIVVCQTCALEVASDAVLSSSDEHVIARARELLRLIDLEERASRSEAPTTTNNQQENQ